MNKAVLVIDMLNDFVTGNLKCDRAQQIVPKIRRLNESARQIEVPVVYLNDAHLPTDFELKIWGPHAMKGTAGAQVIPELAPQKQDYVLEKRAYSGFYETGLEPLLKSLNVGTVYLTGMHTHMCARHTAADAAFRGYDIVPVKDGLQAFTEKDYRDGLRYMGMAYKAQPQKVDEIVKKWRADKNAGNT